MDLTKYFSEMYNQIPNDWNVDLSFKLFGTGTSNEGSEESKAILRYYIEPNDKRFVKIYLNFDETRNIKSIAWFLNKSEMLNLAQLSGLFGSFKSHKVIYDNTSDFVFSPQSNKAIASVSATIYDWVTERPDGTLFFDEVNKTFNVDDEYSVSLVIFHLN